MLLRFWPSLKSHVGSHRRPIRAYRGISQLATLEVKDDTVRSATFYKADIIIVDSNNLAALSKSHWKEWGFKDYSDEAIFADHLKYLAALTESPGHRYAVFDHGRGRADLFMSRSRDFLYHTKKAAGPTAGLCISILEEALQALQRAVKLWQGKPPRHPFWETAAACGYTPVEPAMGWAADDAIAALCKLFADAKERKSVLIVSNDRDLYQVLDEKISILHVPAYKGHTSLDPYRITTLTGFMKVWHIHPYVAPVHAALTGGRPFKKLWGLGLNREEAKKKCMALYESIQRDFPNGEHPPYTAFRKLCTDLLQAENCRVGKKLSSRRIWGLMNTLIANRDVSSLPEQYNVEGSGKGAEGKARKATTPKWMKSPLANLQNPLITVFDHQRAPLPKSPPGAPSARLIKDCLDAFEDLYHKLLTISAEDSLALLKSHGLPKGVIVKQDWQFPTLIWMRPYNKGRANSVRQHVDRLSRILHLLHIKHINWAVSAECNAIDIAVVPNEHSKAVGLSSNIAFLVLGEGDLLEEFQQMCLPPKRPARLSTKQALKSLLQHSQKVVHLSSSAALQVQCLEQEGWTVHKVHHDLLKFYYDLRFAAR